MAAYKKYNTLGGGAERQRDNDSLMNSKIPHITTLQEKEMVTNVDCCVVYISGSWCGPCKEAAPRYEQFAQKYAERVMFVKENVDDGLTKDCTAVPYFEIWSRGRKLAFFSGADFAEIEARLNEILSTIPSKGQDSRMVRRPGVRG